MTHMENQDTGAVSGRMPDKQGVLVQISQLFWTCICSVKCVKC